MIYDVSPVLYIYTFRFTALMDGNCSSIDMTDLTAGVYLLKAWCDDKVYTAKIIKQ